ncbi:MAG: hypothetical protein HYS69_16440, partial [candidate division NC10 bacterium]|nr:hypothetical protein [candidate division NC10 bacterium]
MRKFLWVVAVGALVLAVAAPAMALDFKFGSEYRVRFYAAENLGFGDRGGGVPGANPRGAQLRVRPRFDVSDDNGNITATLRLEIGDIEWGNGGGPHGVTNGPFITSNFLTPGGARVGNGAGGSAGLDGVNVETKWAYIDFAAPFGLPFRVRAGGQPWFTPKGILFDDDIMGVRAYGKVAPLSYEVAWYRASGGPNTAAALGSGQSGQAVTSNTLDNNYDLYQFRGDVPLAPWFNPGVYYIYGRNATNCTPTPCPPTNRVRESHYVGFTTTGKAGIVSYDLDAIYGYADGGPAGTFGTVGNLGPRTVAGYALDGGVHFP